MGMVRFFRIIGTAIGLSLVLATAPYADGGAMELERLRAYLDRAVADQEPMRPEALRRYVQRLDVPRLRALGRELGVELPRLRTAQSPDPAEPIDRASLERFRHRVLERLHGLLIG